MKFNLFEEIVLFIGSNNKTKRLEITKIKTIISKYFNGFSCEKLTGYWKGNEEKTLKVSIIEKRFNKKALNLMASELKAVLEQESILIKRGVISSVFA